MALLSRLRHELVILILGAGNCGLTLFENRGDESAALIGTDHCWGGFREVEVFSED
jgi:hypothetical protein